MQRQTEFETKLQIETETETDTERGFFYSCRVSIALKWLKIVALSSPLTYSSTFSFPSSELHARGSKGGSELVLEAECLRQVVYFDVPLLCFF